jgi:hypothetical protein
MKKLIKKLAVSSEINNCNFTALTLRSELASLPTRQYLDQTVVPILLQVSLDCSNGRFRYSMLLPSYRLSFSLQVVVLPLQVVEPLQVVVLLQVVLQLQVVHPLQVVILLQQGKVLPLQIGFLLQVIVLPQQIIVLPL